MTADEARTPGVELEQVLMIVVFDPSVITPTDIVAQVNDLDGAGVFSVDPDPDEEDESAPRMVDVDLPEPGDG